MALIIHYSNKLTTRLFLKASLLFVACLFFIIFLGSCDKRSSVEALLITGPTMGTSYNITVVDPPDNIDKYELQIDVDKLLIGINKEMSTYIADSEISIFNNSSVNTWQKISPDFFNVLELSQSISLLTNGRFDITVGPLVDLWGFGAGSNDDQKIPDQQLLDTILSNVGWTNLILDKENTSIKKLKSIRIDLSAVAKGYGVDKIAELLSSKKIDNYLVEIGGEVKVKGLNKDKESWRLGIEVPSLLQKSVQKIVHLTDQAIATSGDYRNYFEENGTRFSHTIDPISGGPVRHNIASVSVIADTTAKADALATALNVLGEEAALDLSEKENIAAYFILYDNEDTENKYRVVHSKAFIPFLNQ
jgi:thiamine biosynthesis lipoprotein